MSLSIIIVFAIFLQHDEIETSAHCHCPGKNLIIVSHVHSNTGHKAKKLTHDTTLIQATFSLHHYNKTICANSPFILSAFPLISLTAPTILRL